MKQIILVLILLFTSLSAHALNVRVESLTAVNSETENDIFEAKILKDAKFKSGFEFKKYTIMYFKIVETVPPKPGKRSAYMVIRPFAVTDAENWMMPLEETDILGKTGTLKLIKKPDIKNDLKENAKSVAKSAVKCATKEIITKTANITVPGSAQIYQISKGLILPEDGRTRFESAADNLIDNSVLKYFKPGEDLNIKEGDIFLIDFYHSDIPAINFGKRRK